jgi:hypothetical protein
MSLKSQKQLQEWDTQSTVEKLLCDLDPRRRFHPQFMLRHRERRAAHEQEGSTPRLFFLKTAPSRALTGPGELPAL